MSSHSLGLMTVSEAADYLNIPRPTLYQHLREGRIPGIQIGGRWRIESKELRRVVVAEPEASASPPATIQQQQQDLQPARSPDTTTSLGEPEYEIQKLTEENRRLREIIAQQLLELHTLTLKSEDAFEPSSDGPESAP